MRGSSRIELKVNGGLHSVAPGLAHDDREIKYDLTPLVDGADRFTLIFWVDNSSQKPILGLDHWGVRGEVR
jgi:hypothetical protein